MTKQKEPPTEFLETIVAVAEHQLDKERHPLTCICGGHAVMLPTLIQTTGASPEKHIGLVCPFCGEKQLYIPKGIITRMKGFVAEKKVESKREQTGWSHTDDDGTVHIVLTTKVSAEEWGHNLDGYWKPFYEVVELEAD